MFNLITFQSLISFMNDNDFSDVCSIISDCSYISEFDNEIQSINFDLSSEHYLLDCFLYTVERQNLYNQVEHYIPNFSKL